MLHYAKLCIFIQDNYCKLCNLRLYYTPLYGFQGLIMHFYSERYVKLWFIMHFYPHLQPYRDHDDAPAARGRPESQRVDGLVA